MARYGKNIWSEHFWNELKRRNSVYKMLVEAESIKISPELAPLQNCTVKAAFPVLTVAKKLFRLLLR